VASHRTGECLMPPGRYPLRGVRLSVIRKLSVCSWPGSEHSLCPCQSHAVQEAPLVIAILDSAHGFCLLLVQCCNVLEACHFGGGQRLHVVVLSRRVAMA
jgi:hypothetical protein